jgi:hypothetical protein
MAIAAHEGADSGVSNWRRCELSRLCRLLLLPGLFELPLQFADLVFDVGESRGPLARSELAERLAGGLPLALVDLSGGGPY